MLDSWAEPKLLYFKHLVLVAEEPVLLGLAGHVVAVRNGASPRHQRFRCTGQEVELSSGRRLEGCNTQELKS